MPPQVIRLVLLTIGIVGTYLVARSFLTPPSFGQFGWYRGDALEELRTRPLSFAGKKACEECHPGHIATLQKGSHKGLSCETCHGPCEAHVDNQKHGDKGDKPDKKDITPCMRCHEANPSRPKWHKQIILKSHYTGQKCVECHVPHQPNEVP